MQLRSIIQLSFCFGLACQQDVVLSIPFFVHTHGTFAVHHAAILRRICSLLLLTNDFDNVSGKVGLTKSTRSVVGTVQGAFCRRRLTLFWNGWIVACLRAGKEEENCRHCMEEEASHGHGLLVVDACLQFVVIV